MLKSNTRKVTPSFTGVNPNIQAPNQSMQVCSNSTGGEFLSITKSQGSIGHTNSSTRIRWRSDTSSKVCLKLCALLVSLLSSKHRACVSAPFINVFTVSKLSVHKVNSSFGHLLWKYFDLLASPGLLMWNWWLWNAGLSVYHASYYKASLLQCKFCRVQM